jgi:hypothetical protein
MNDPWVVDTNVGIVANGRDEDGPHRPESVIACVKFIKKFLEGSDRIAIDEDWEIIREYRNDLHSTGQPGAGDKFLKWVLINNANPERCHRVDISTIPAPEQLEDFDPPDIKFIRTALGCPSPRIAEATDGLWWYRRADFEAAGIEVNFLCPVEIKNNSDRKYGPS